VRQHLTHIVLTLQNKKMGSRSKRFDIFNGPNSDHERPKPLNTKDKRRLMRGKQTILLMGTEMMGGKTRSQRIVEQKVRPRRKQKQSIVKTRESRGGERNKPRRSARLEAQKFKDVMKI
jgi:hypothetical protein